MRKLAFFLFALAFTGAASAGGFIQGTSIGVADGSDACTGCVGEYLSSATATATLFPTSTQYMDGVALTLTAGDWELSAIIDVAPTGSTYTFVNLGISTNTGNNSSNLVLGDSRATWGFSNATWANLPTNLAITVPTYRASVNTSTTYYLKAGAVYSAGAPKFNAKLRARRIR